MKFFRLKVTSTLLLVMVLFLSACTSYTYRPSLSQHVKLSVEQADNLLIALNNNALHKPLKALYQVDLNSKDFNTSYRYAVITSNFNKLYLQTLPSTSFYAINILKINQDRAYFKDNESKREFFSEDPDDLIESELGLNLPSKYLASLFYGRFPITIVNPKSLNSYYISEGKILITSDEESIFWVIGQNYLLEQVQFWDKDNQSLNAEIKFGDFNNVNAHNIPNVINLNIPKYSTVLELKSRTIDLSSPIKIDTFNF